MMGDLINFILYSFDLCKQVKSKCRKCVSCIFIAGRIKIYGGWIRVRPRSLRSLNKMVSMPPKRTEINITQGRLSNKRLTNDTVRFSLDNICLN